MCLLPRSARQTDADRMHNTIHVGGVSVTSIEQFRNAPYSPAEFFPGTDLALWHTDRVPIVVRGWLLRGQGRTVLVDTGLDTTRTFDIEIPAGTPLIAGLAAAGVESGDIDVVVCTHLHADHVGGNTRQTPDGQRVPAFPNARYFFSRPDPAF